MENTFEKSIAGMMALGKYPDLSGLSEEEKGKAIKDFVEITSRYFLQLFLMLGLKTHIETMIVNDVTGKEYIMTFQTVDHSKEITSLHAFELSKRDELIEAYKELIADIDLHKGTTITEVTLRATISDLIKQLGKI
jgi:hypothetical protein